MTRSPSGRIRRQVFALLGNAEAGSDLLRHRGGMFGHLRQAHQFAEGSTGERARNIEALNRAACLVDRARCQIAVDAEPSRIRSDHARAAKLGR